LQIYLIKRTEQITLSGWFDRLRKDSLKAKSFLLDITIGIRQVIFGFGKKNISTINFINCIVQTNKIKMNNKKVSGVWMDTTQPGLQMEILK
jgi:hypothetical protein